MEQDKQFNSGELEQEYVESVYLSIQSALTVAETLKDLEVIEAQCESIKGYSDVDAIRTIVRQKMELLGDQPDLDRLLEERIRRRKKRQKNALVILLVLLLIGGTIGTGTAIYRNAQRQRYLSALSLRQTTLEQYAAEEYATANKLFASKDYEKALNRLVEAHQVGLERQRIELEAGRKRLFEESERQRKAKEAELARHAAITERQRQDAEAEARRLEEQRTRKQEELTQRAAEERKEVEEKEARWEQDDLRLLQKAETEVLNILKRLQFNVVNEMLKSLQPRLKSQKGKAGFSRLQEQANRFQNFHNELSAIATGRLLVRGGQIDASDDKEITMSGKKIAWNDVYALRPELLNEIIESRLLNEETLQALSRGNRAERLTNMALCLYLFYSESPSAMDKAKRTLARMLKESPNYADTVSKLFPASITDGLSKIDYQPACAKCKERYCLKCLSQKTCVACAGQGRILCRNCGGLSQTQGTEYLKCARCGGAGERPGLDGPMKCLTCKGTGKIPQATYSVCRSCDGKGRVTCTSCDGKRYCQICKGTGLRASVCPACGKTW